MVRIFKTVEGAIHEIQEPEEGCWIALTSPTATEIYEISEQFGIEVDDLRAPLDEEERSRIEVEDTYTLILADVPTIEERNEKDWYVTIPLGIIVTQKGSYEIYGRKSEKSFHIYENTFHPSDSLQKCEHVSALSAYYR